jgi:hypothetical protein
VTSIYSEMPRCRDCMVENPKPPDYHATSVLQDGVLRDYRVSATGTPSTLAGPLGDSAVHDRDMMG